MAYKQSNNPISRKTSPLRDKGNHPHPHKPGVISEDKLDLSGDNTSMHPQGKPNPNPLIGQPMPDVPYEKISDMEEIGDDQPDYEDPDWKPSMSRKSSSPLSDESFADAVAKESAEPDSDAFDTKSKRQKRADDNKSKDDKKEPEVDKRSEGEKRNQAYNYNDDKKEPKVDNSRKAIRGRKSKAKETGKSKRDTRISKTKSKAEGAREQANESKDADRQMQLRAKGKRLDKRAKRQEGRKERKAIRKSDKSREDKKTEITASRAKQKNK